MNKNAIKNNVHGEYLGDFIRSNFTGGEEYTAEIKLFTDIGFKHTKSPCTIESYKRETMRHMNYAKLNEKSRKVTINEIYDESLPLNKYIRKMSDETQYIINEIKDIILSLGTTKISYQKLIEENIFQEIEDKPTSTNQSLYYKNYLFDALKGKINIALKQLYNEYKPHFNYKYTYIGKDKDSSTWQELSAQDIEYIESMKKIIQDEITVKHNDKNRLKNYTWNQIAFRYRFKLYQQLEKDLTHQKNIERIAKVLIIENNIKPTSTVLANSYITNFLKQKMETYISTKEKYVNEQVVEYHKNIFHSISQ